MKLRPPLNVVRHGLIDYQAAVALQQEYSAMRRAKEIGDTLLLVEHPPVVTLGIRKESAADLLAPREELKRRGVELVQTDRGGLATLHAPGQLVGYYFVRLHGIPGGLRVLIASIHHLLIGTCAEFGVEATEGADEPGVWIGPRKIASLGLAIRRGITRHGFALNVANDLELFSLLRPCGHQSGVMTSLSRELRRTVQVDEVAARLAQLAKEGD